MKWWITGAVVLVAAAIVPTFLDPTGYAIRVLTLALLFAALGQAWNIVGGLANQISLGHAAFFGLGAYTSTILLINFGLSPWIGMLAGAAIAAVAAYLLSFPTMKLRGHYFALATLAFSEVLRVIAGSWTSVTGGPVGLSVPFSPDSFWLLQFKSTMPYYYIMLGALVVISGVFVWIRHSSLGYRLRALKENPEAAEVVGVNTTQVKISAAVISAALTATLGTLYAQFTYFFDPEAVFGIIPISVRAAIIAILGGAGTVVGPIIGAFLIVPMEEMANVLLSSRGAGLSQLAFGVMLIAIILIEPRGILALITNGVSRLRRRKSS
ncbi:branched-chain amino acid ABC transporter permease [Afifella marina]|uniref:Branched-chain amino acid transport system permease protein n=1 Tax=Afifella marina DSM 2698 TaxID=1120955 RepID=A0A1G5NAZ1_AFIMA|nr:branched-chain amino acid ABC transporter permease [Afifella marina]MBK1623079.1 branched-chain amino acid ABC transporter permease [Afifella marina DSM 2698]MBK1626073.1 branched-chain amino acid ABC transporter permease [Afifella marina]MBK5916951.1 branched-chain amino acid ABC transporter permease [Afifella marina]RAI21955.1 branched-chain amino acid ABC transporter permease [Afifella marina DSM 2698]SCZ33951.1 branched-chain amino acid transport system permease protein [Afifella marina